MLRWLLTYADMITLLMAFFIMLYSMSILNLNKFQEVAVSIRSGFAGLVEGQGKSILASSGQFSVKPSAIQGESVGVPWRVVKHFQRMIKEEKLENLVKLRADDRGLIVSMASDKVVFERGQVNLTPKALGILDSIGPMLREIPNTIIVEGHTCDLPISNAQCPSNVHLSAARAANVAYYLIHNVGIPAERISVAGYAETRPLVPNTSEANRAMNRRVDLVLAKSIYR